MLLQKTLHMSQPLAECKARLASIQSYRRQFLMVTRATVTSSKTVDFSFRGPLGFEAHTVLLSVESDSPDQYTFESVGGNINLMGIVDFAEIRPNCTEVTLAVHYEIRNKLFAWLDRRVRFVEPGKQLVPDLIVNCKRYLRAVWPDLSEVNDSHQVNIPAHGLKRVLIG